MDWRETRAGKRWVSMYGHRKRMKITWLARARLLSGQSVAQAAKACGLSPRSWERWEQGRSSPPSAAAIVIIDRYPVPLSALLDPYVRVNPATLEVLP